MCVGRITYNCLPLCVCFFTYIISRHNGMLYPMLIARNRKNLLKNFYIEFLALKLTCVPGIKHTCKAGMEAIGRNIKSTHVNLSIGSREYLLCETDLGSYVGEGISCPIFGLLGGGRGIGDGVQPDSDGYIQPGPYIGICLTSGMCRDCFCSKSFLRY